MPTGFKIILFIYFLSIPGYVKALFNGQVNLTFALSLILLSLTILILWVFKKKNAWGWKLLIGTAIYGILTGLVYLLGGNKLSTFPPSVQNMTLIIKSLGLLFNGFIIFYTYKNRHYFSKG